MGADGRRAWQMSAVELTGSTLGIIGLGGFGMEMVQRARGYDMTILAIDPVRQDKPDEVAELKPATRETCTTYLAVPTRLCSPVLKPRRPII